MPIFNANGEEIKVTAPAGAGENAQEVAEPAEDSTHDTEHSSVAEKSPDEDTTADDTSAGENAQEVAAPAASDDAESGQMPDTTAQSRAERGKQAAARRAREMDTAKTDAQREMLAALDLTDPATGKKVTTPEEFRAYITHRDAGRTDEQLRRAGVDPDAIREAIAGDPMVKATEDAIAAAENAEAEANRRAESLSLDAAIAEVTRLNPDIRSFDDLYALPEYSDIKKLVGAGYSFGRAYEMATVDRARQGAKQAAYNAVASKAHMTKTSGSVGDAYTISDRQLENYRQLHPNATRAEAVAAFKKYQPKKGK